VRCFIPCKKVFKQGSFLSQLVFASFVIGTVCPGGTLLACKNQRGCSVIFIPIPYPLPPAQKEIGWGIKVEKYSFLMY
jgi:hypothetical protein